jgi:hypothetical protein
MIGFTGTRQGMSEKQLREVASLLQELVRELQSRSELVVALHGDAIGADAQFDEIAYRQGLPRRIYPSNIDSQRAHCQYNGAAVMQPPKPPLERNKDIILASLVMIGAPASFQYERSGTWSTIRKAKQMLRPVYIVNPYGFVERPK